MPLPTPRKGTAPATGRVKPAAAKPSRAEQLLSATLALASEQLPDEHTMHAIEGAPDERSVPVAAAGVGGGAPSSAVPEPGAPTTTRAGAPGVAATDTAAVAPASAQSADGGVTSAAAGPTMDGVVVREIVIADVRPSPFQPKGRPSVAAVEAVARGIANAGSLEALVGPDGTALFALLDQEAGRLAELAFDIAANGMKLPLEVRTAEDGATELLSGHRRLAAARLAGHTRVPALHRGAMTSAAAAATVLRGNLHRENFTTWQEAVLVSEVQDRRRADGYRDTVRTLGTVMGWSHGKVNMLLRIKKALAPAFLARVGGGDAARVEEELARRAYRDLERLAAEPDEARREVLVRRLLGWTTPAAGAAAADGAVCRHRPKRGGGFVIEVGRPVEALAAGDAALLREILEAQLTRVKARLDALRPGA